MKGMAATTERVRRDGGNEQWGVVVKLVLTGDAVR